MKGKKTMNEDEVFGQQINDEELAAFSGGVTERDWLTQGCAKTVEIDSDCMALDGGCSSSNIKYVNAPVAVCPCCNKYGILVDGRKKVDLGNPCPDYLYSYHCFYCGMKFEESAG